MKTNKEIFEAIKGNSPERAVASVLDFIKTFKTQKVIRDSGILRLDEFYSGRYTLSKLILETPDSELALHLYDEEKWCRGCEYNCSRVMHNIQLARLLDSSAEKIARESLKDEYPLMHALSRNLLLGLDGFRTLLNTYRGREYHNPIEESASLNESDYYCYKVEIPYKEAINLVKGFREIPKID
jgi:hypothetical protein